MTIPRSPSSFSEIFHTDPLEKLREHITLAMVDGEPSCLICSRFKLMGHYIYCNRETPWRDARWMKSYTAHRYRKIAQKCTDFAGYS